jgi:predicted acyl esterase
VPYGYAVVNVDVRGAYNSEGDMQFFGPQDAQDSYDVIEWLAKQEWCNGKIGLNGNSWYGMVQWKIAEAQPPHLAAIAPWEAETNIYRDEYVRDGIPMNTGSFMARSYGANRVEDLPAMIKKYPLMNSYWESKIADFGKITVPAYIVASYVSQMHTRGTLESFNQIASKDKWLRVHDTQEWPDMYDQKNVADLRRFFDHYLKGIDNGWESTPRVRLSVLDPGGLDVVNRVENEFPLARQEFRKLYLDAASAKLTTNPISQEDKVSYNTDAQGKTAFTIQFDQETEITGFIKLRLWVEADGADDMDVFARIVKLDKNGQPLFHDALMYKYAGPDGRLRVFSMNPASTLKPRSRPEGDFGRLRKSRSSGY